MTVTKKKRPPNTALVRGQFKAYFDKHKLWGDLEHVLYWGNFKDEDVVICKEIAERHKDEEGVALADLLLILTENQRKGISDRALDKWDWTNWKRGGDLVEEDEEEEDEEEEEDA
jgi:hypothetical protein